jgi:hypothetical protein
MDLRGIDPFTKQIDLFRREISVRIEKILWEIMFKLQREAKRRVPVDTGFLRNSININVTTRPSEAVGEIGTHVIYGVYLEYGTKWIAGGAVKALGTSPEITDAEAIKSWPALVERGGSGQQMPWLRTAVNSQEDWIQQKFTEALDFG